VEALAETEGITVFAPVNSAFEAALKQVNLTAAELLAEEGLVTDILLYHVVPAVARAADLVNGQILPTLNGQVRPAPQRSMGRHLHWQPRQQLAGSPRGTARSTAASG
jgi:uncharacterized surface protein with fasciclin (FAS1) repeats